MGSYRVHLSLSYIYCSQSLDLAFYTIQLNLRICYANLICMMGIFTGTSFNFWILLVHTILHGSPQIPDNANLLPVLQHLVPPVCWLITQMNHSEHLPYTLVIPSDHEPKPTSLGITWARGKVVLPQFIS